MGTSLICGNTEEALRGIETSSRSCVKNSEAMVAAWTGENTEEALRGIETTNDGFHYTPPFDFLGLSGNTEETLRGIET